MKMKRILYNNKILLGVITVILGLILFLYCVKNFCFVSVSGNSMFPTLCDGEVLIGKKTFLFVDNEDIVVFKRNNNIYIKRVIAQYGDYVEVDEAEGIVYVNGKAKVVYEPNVSTKKRMIKISQNEFFVVGDNYNDSLDSRDEKIGLIRESEIIAIICK